MTTHSTKRLIYFKMSVECCGVEGECWLHTSVSIGSNTYGGIFGIHYKKLYSLFNSAQFHRATTRNLLPMSRTDSRNYTLTSKGFLVGCTIYFFLINIEKSVTI